MSRHRVFVYGTLRNGAPPSHRLPGYMMFGVRGRAFDFPFIQAYPWADALPSVLGNLIEVDAEGLAKLDAYENVGSGLYERITATVYRLGQQVAAPELVQVYVGGSALAYQPIPSGVWEPKE